MQGQKFYAVRRGHRTGMFNTWNECQRAVNGYSGAEFKSFKSRAEAEAFLAGGAVAPASKGRVGRSPPGSSRKRTSPSSAPAPAPAAPSGLQSTPDHAATGPGTSQPNGSGRGVVDPSQLYTVEFDGGSRGNPGLAGFGATLRGAGGRLVQVTAGYLTLPSTNNEAEYQGALVGLQAALAAGVRRVQLVGDSELIVRQINGVYKVNSPNLQPLHKGVVQVRGQFTEARPAQHVLRQYNKAADQLGNVAMNVLARSRGAGALAQDGPVPPAVCAALQDALTSQAFAQAKAGLVVTATVPVEGVDAVRQPTAAVTPGPVPVNTGPKRRRT